MMLRNLLAAAVFAWASPALADMSLLSEQHNVSITSSTGFGCSSGANYAVVQVVSDSAFYTMNGSTPSSTNGYTLQQNQSVAISGSIFVENFKIITAASGGKINFFCAMQ